MTFNDHGLVVDNWLHDIIMKDSHMNQSKDKRNKYETYTAGMANITVGLIAYLFLVVPTLTFTIVGAMNLAEHYGIAVAVALVITGMYVTEKTACLDI
jgi:hypothetical protein